MQTAYLLTIGVIFIALAAGNFIQNNKPTPLIGNLDPEAERTELVTKPESEKPLPETEDHDVHGGEILWAESTMPALTKNFTGEEWVEMTKDDEVKRFTERVNAAALAKDYWSKDFRCALYDAFVEEGGKRLCEKYNNGEGFSITGPLE